MKTDCLFPWFIRLLNPEVQSKLWTPQKRSNVTAPEPLIGDNNAKDTRELNAPWNVSLGAAQNIVRHASSKGAAWVPRGQVWELVDNVGAESIGTMRILQRRRFLAACTVRVLRVPHIGVLTLSAPLGKCMKTDVRLHYVVWTNVAENCANMVEDDPIPLVYLSLGGIAEIRKWVVLIEQFLLSENSISARAYMISKPVLQRREQGPVLVIKKD